MFYGNGRLNEHLQNGKLEYEKFLDQYNTNLTQTGRGSQPLVVDDSQNSRGKQLGDEIQQQQQQQQQQNLQQ